MIIMIMTSDNVNKLVINSTKTDAFCRFLFTCVWLEFCVDFCAKGVSVVSQFFVCFRFKMTSQIKISK